MANGENIGQPSDSQCMRTRRSSFTAWQDDTGQQVSPYWLLSGTTISESHAVVKGLRDIEFANLVAKQHVSNWIHQTYRASYVGPPLPPAIGYIATLRSRLHIMAEGGAPLCSHKQSAGRAAERLVNPITTTSLLEAMVWGRELCGNCMAKAPAGLRGKILQT